MMIGLSLLLPALLLAQAPRPAVPSTNSDAVIQALVTEIRELRLSLERSQLLTLRFQAALQTNQIHADRLKDLSQQLNGVRAQVSQKNMQSANLAENIERAMNDPNPAVRREFEPQLPHLKLELASVNQELAALSARESYLLSEIQRETTQMDDWSRWLQQFEQSLRK